MNRDEAEKAVDDLTHCYARYVRGDASSYELDQLRTKIIYQLVNNNHAEVSIDLVDNLCSESSAKDHVGEILRIIRKSGIRLVS